MVRAWAGALHLWPVALLSNPMNNPTTDPTTTSGHPALSSEFTKRLAQLGMSRREFARKSGLSRQTVHNIEVEQRTDLAPATYAALDTTLRWATGRALALAIGNADFEDNDGLTQEERANGLRWQIVKRLDSMSIEELETMVYQWADNQAREQQDTNN